MGLGFLPGFLEFGNELEEEEDRLHVDLTQENNETLDPDKLATPDSQFAIARDTVVDATAGVADIARRDEDEGTLMQERSRQLLIRNYVESTYRCGRIDIFESPKEITCAASDGRN
jgi:hypothetical protein